MLRGLVPLLPIAALCCLAYDFCLLLLCILRSDSGASRVLLGPTCFGREKGLKEVVLS